MDKIDLQILSWLQRDATLSAGDIGEKVGLSSSPCARRIRQLDSKGYIQGVHATLNKKAVGLSMTVFVQVRLSEHKDAVVAQFEESVSAMAEVISCHTVSGAFDYLLQVVCSDLEMYEKWVRRLQRLDMVNNLDSSFAIRAVKENAPLPLVHI